jgi:DNA-binding NtrC family response regulator
MLLENCAVGLIEDDPVMGESLVQSLTLEGCHVDWWRSGSEAVCGLRSTSPDLVVCDIRLPDVKGDELFRQIAAIMALPPFMFITAYGDIDQAVAVMREGASDYITKPFQMSDFIARTRALMRRYASPPSGTELGVSAEIRSVESVLKRVADLTTTMLITGETGVGKEVCAHFLHKAGVRSKEPFIVVNCAAIPSDAMERELFGYRGTSGKAFHQGFAERCRSGILFLDEVSELTIELQAKLLRLVEAREYHRVGGEQLMQFRGRIVCSSNRSLEELIRQKKFRADLYYRINALVVEVPPLRSRRDDIPWLIEQFLAQFSREDDRGPRGVSTLAYEAALEYPWPGNVRELRNRMQRAVALTRTEWIMPGDLFPDAAPSIHPMERVIVGKPFATLSETRDMAERRQIQRALHQTNGQILEAARLLGVSRTTLWEKMKRLSISGEISQ